MTIETKHDNKPQFIEIECICLQYAGMLNFTKKEKPIDDCQLCDGKGKIKKPKRG